MQRLSPTPNLSMLDVIKINPHFPVDKLQALELLEKLESEKHRIQQHIDTLNAMLEPQVRTVQQTEPTHNM